MSLAPLISIAADLVEIMALGLIVIQLVYLRKQIRLDAFLKILVGNRELIGMGLNHPELLSVIEEGKKDKEKAKVERYAQIWINQIYLIHKGHKENLYDTETWNAYQADIKDFLKLKSAREQWESSKTYYPESFQDFMNGLLLKK